MIYHFIERDANGAFLMQHHIAWDGEGPPAPPEPMPGGALEAIPKQFDMHAPSPTSILTGSPLHWAETASAVMILPGVIATIDATADAARLMAIGDPARAIEYQRAEFQARAYAAAGYTGIVPRCVKAWAGPKGWTGQQAADDIIATAERWYEALDTIRELRLAAKESARSIAGDPDGEASAIYAVKTTFLSTIHTLMQGLA